ncbi:MAG: GMC family oxidoreductase [Myxococcales bacterium]|nr:GMC family oxidoreductase [Myxococcales bacterium]
MLIDANDLSDGASLSYDVCVVGAGAAGITLARALRGSGLTVGVLESGGFELERRTQDLYQGVMSGLGTWELDGLRFRLFGGSTSAWAGWCKPLDPHDFDERAHIPNSGWPISFADLEPYYAQANALVEIGDAVWDGAALASALSLPRVLSGSERVKTAMFQFSPPTQFGEVYRDDLLKAEDVEVVLHANVVDVVLESGLDAVDHLAAATLSGIGLTVEASAFVLATGGIETPRLLLASDGQRSEGVANSSGAVGRYFMEHPHYRDSALWVMNGRPQTDLYDTRRVTVSVGDLSLDDTPVRGMLELQPDTLAEEGIVSFTARLVNAGDADVEPLTTEMVTAMLQAEADRQWPMRLTLHTEQIPHPDSRITLLPDQRDALGVPRVDLDWRLQPEDLRGVERGLQILAAEIGAAGEGRLWIPASEQGIDWIAVPGGHHMGTARMSADPATGVVDADCRCHDVGNLYLAGSSVFTTGGNANPTLTIVALALRLADHLRETL